MTTEMHYADHGVAGGFPHPATACATRPTLTMDLLLRANDLLAAGRFTTDAEMRAWKANADAWRAELLQHLETARSALEDQ